MTYLFDEDKNFLGLDGRLLASGKVYFCVPDGTANISTLKTVYTTHARGTPTANPQTLTATGRFAQEVHGSGLYDVVIKTSALATVRTLYNVPAGYAADALNVAFTPSSGATTTDVQTFLQAIYKRTALEIAAGVTPTDYYRLPGQVMRYADAVGDGSADDSAALLAACSTGHRVLGCGPEYTYLITSNVALERAIDFDGQGCTIKPSGNTNSFYRNLSPTASTTASSGATLASRQIVVASATSIVTGVWLAIYVQSGTDEDYRPYAWVTVTNVAGTTITFDRPLPIDYTGAEPITVAVYTAAQILSHAKFRNTKFDGSATTYTSDVGQGLRLSGFREVLIENCEAIDFDNTNTSTEAWIAISSIDVMYRGNVLRGQIAGNQQMGATNCRTVLFADNILDGSSFGMSSSMSEVVSFIGNALYGRSKQETNDAVSPLRSVRGVKAQYVAKVIIKGNSISDYESPVKINSVWRYIIEGNQVYNASIAAAYSGQVAINVSNVVAGTNTFGGSVSGNIVENCSGIGIGVLDDILGLVVIANNVVRNCVASGIATTNPRNVIFANNIVENWANAGGAYFAIQHTNGAANITGNRFVNSDATRTCLSVTTVSGQKMVVRDNVAVSGNPMGFVLENSGTATIASGTTSLAVAHGLSVTPSASDIQLTPTENATADPGTLWVSTIGATNFTINCRVDPGASNLDVAWRVDVRLPYTA